MCVNERTQKMWPSQQTRSNILAGELKSSEASCLHNCFSFMFGKHNFFSCWIRFLALCSLRRGFYFIFLTVQQNIRRILIWHSSHSCKRMGVAGCLMVAAKNRHRNNVINFISFSCMAFFLSDQDVIQSTMEQ